MLKAVFVFWIQNNWLTRIETPNHKFKELGIVFTNFITLFHSRENIFTLWKVFALEAWSERKAMFESRGFQTLMPLQLRILLTCSGISNSAGLRVGPRSSRPCWSCWFEKHILSSKIQKAFWCLVVKLRCCLMGIKFQWCKMKKFWRSTTSCLQLTILYFTLKFC